MATKFTSRTPWRAKLEKPQDARVFDICGKFLKRYGPGKMVIPRPLDVDAVMRRVGKGKLATISVLRARLAKDYHADIT